MRSRSTSAVDSSSVCPSPVSSRTATTTPLVTSSPAPTAISLTTPVQGAGTTCSIFMASTTSSGEPARTGSPGRTEVSTTTPCRGADTATLPGGTSPANPAAATSEPSSGREDPATDLRCSLSFTGGRSSVALLRSHDRHERHALPGASAQVVGHREGPTGRDGRDAAFVRRLAPKLQPALVHHPQAGCADRMPERLQPPVGVDGKLAVEVEHAAERVLPRLSAL